MEKTFYNARELAEYFTQENFDKRTYPRFIDNLYCEDDNPLNYFLVKIYDKYVRGKSVFAKECDEFKKAKLNAINFVEQEIIKQGYTLSILYKCNVTYSDGYSTVYDVCLISIPQQLKFNI